MKLAGTMTVDGGMLQIGGVGVDRLADQFGTPLYIIDLADFRQRARIFLDHFRSARFETQVVYASKAFINLYMAQVLEEMGLYADSVSDGEFTTLDQAGFNLSRVYYHGNNKSEADVRHALLGGCGHMVIDGQEDYELVSQLARSLDRPVSCLLRVNPNIEADTHQYIQTTKEDAKFGMNTHDPRTKDLIRALGEDPYLDFAGLHCHIGSQVLKGQFFFQEAQAMAAFAREVETDCGLAVRTLNLGGGFGVYYTAEDQPFDLADFLDRYIQAIEEAIDQEGLTHIQTVAIEPGRSLINESGSTLYRVGSAKATLAGLPFVFVDGGMSDNLRPALYQAKYEACLANKMDQAPAARYRVGGKLCESGDVLIQEVALPEPERGDLLLVPRTGAYTYSMNSQYNRLGCPAVVFVEDGMAELGVKRVGSQEITRDDLPYQKLRHR